MNSRVALLAALVILSSAPLAAQTPAQACELLTATPVFPQAGAQVPALLTFRWQGPDLSDPRIPADLQARFQVFVSRDGGEFSLLGETVDDALTRFLEPGSYRWFVRATASGCPFQRPTVVPSFTIASRSDCGVAMPVPTTPAPGAVIDGSEVRLVWSPVSGADAYRVILRRVPDAPFRTRLTRNTEMTLELPSGTFFWRVVALTSGCAPAISPPRGFRVEGCELERPILIAPAEGTAGLASPVTFTWSAVPGAERYRVWAKQGRETIDSLPMVLGETTETTLTSATPSGAFGWWVQALGADGCTSASSPRTLSASNLTGCPEPRRPRLHVPASATSGEPFTLAWTQIPGATSYEIEEADDPSFAGATMLPSQSANVLQLVRESATRAPRFFRVRAVIGCSGARSEFSAPSGVVITPDLSSIEAASAGEATATVTVCLIDGKLRSCGAGETGNNPSEETHTVVADQEWIEVEPSPVTFPPNGTATLTLRADASLLPVGTNRAGLRIETPAGKSALNGSGGTVTVSVTLVTPVSATPPATPTPSTLILPAVAHAPGAFGSTWETDVRLLNASPQPIRYEITYTPSGTNGTETGTRSEIEADPGESVALDDVLESWFAEEVAIGTLAIRPLDVSEDDEADGALNFASSRTFNISGSGTFGQFVPALPFEQFIGKEDAAGNPLEITLQQLAHNDAFRTNVGLAEGAGESAEVELSIFSPSGTLLATHPVFLEPREHVQINGLLGELGLTADDFRIEANVKSDTGRVTVYASRVDNRTGDPIVAYPEAPNAETEAWIVPGVAAINTGAANWRTDLRIHNPTEETVSATLTFYPQGAPEAPQSTDIELQPGEMKAMNDILVTLWGIPSGGGAVHVTTDDDVPLAVTGETHNLTDEGTFGLFLRGVPRSEGVGVEDRTLQILQIEESERFRTNLGLAEVTGQPVSIEISAVIPESRVTPILPLELKANEFIQILGIIKALNLPSTYNGRIAVRAVGGEGKVTAYAAVVDNVTGDPTYVPAQ
ncbi:MAG: hypothetical protein ACRD2J_06845 [Thermoanaerobaculia bacterium]